MKAFIKNVDKLLLGSITVLFSILISVLCWIFKFDDTIPMWLYIVTMIGCYLCCIVIYAVCKSNENTIVYRLPKIRSITKLNDKCVFVVERNDLFSQGSYATICYQEDSESLELVLGLGYVQSINSAGYLQVVFESIPNTDVVMNVCNKIENTRFYRENIRIKPSIDKKLFEEAINNV